MPINFTGVQFCVIHQIRLIVMTRDQYLTQIPKLQTIYNLTTLKPPIIIPDISPTDEDLGDTATSSDSDRTDTEVPGENDKTHDDSENNIDRNSNGDEDTDSDDKSDDDNDNNPEPSLVPFP